MMKVTWNNPIKPLKVLDLQKVLEFFLYSGSYHVTSGIAEV